MRQNDESLTFFDHRRDSAGLKYVYPVISRRAGGVSIGINLNTNNACNWACIYCQVPGLVRGKPEAVDLPRFESEFDGFLAEVLNGDFMQRKVPEATRRLADVAFSGNGEPTAAAEFPAVVDLVIAAMRARSLLSAVPIRLITNGSLLARKSVRQAIGRLGENHGEVWFKIDSGTAQGIARVNQVRLDPKRMIDHLLRCAELAPTWIQTCWFGIDGTEPALEETAAYLDVVAQVRERIQGVLLYGIARPPMQPGAERLEKLPPEVLEKLGRQIERLGVAVGLSP